MEALDFNSALAHLLRDGALRERFLANPADALEELQITPDDRAALAAIDGRDLEAQAAVLLRKRFDGVRHLAPSTCAALGGSGWEIFSEYARYCWPASERDEWADAHAFLRGLKDKYSDALHSAEWNRAEFAIASNPISLRCARSLRPGRTFAPGMQIFWRSRSGTWREVAFYFSW